MKSDHAVARSPKRCCDGKSEVHEQDGELDEVDGAVVCALDGKRDLDQVVHVVQAEVRRSVPNAILPAEEQLYQIPDGEEQRD